MTDSSHDFCQGGLWNTSLFLDQLWPELTPCFISIVPIWVPCFYVWLLLPFSVWKMKKKKGTQSNLSKDDILTQQKPGGNDVIQITAIFKLKMLLLILQAVVSIVDVIRLLTGDGHLVDILSGFILLVTYVSLCSFAMYQRRRGYDQSFISFYFFVLTMVLGATRLYMWLAIWGVANGIFPFTDVMILYVLNLICFVLTFFRDNAIVQYEPVGRPECPEKTSPYPSQLFFTWMRSLMVDGFRHDLSYEDVWKMNPRDTSRKLTPPFEKLWSEEVERVKEINKKRSYLKSERSLKSSIHYKSSDESKPLIDGGGAMQYHTVDSISKKKEAKPNVFVVLTKLLWKTVLIGLIKKALGDSITFLGPVLLGAFITVIQSNDDKRLWQAYALSVLLLVTGLMRSIFFAQTMYMGSLIGLQMKTVLTNAIYKKALSISGSAKKNMTVGDIVNLMSVDCQRLQEMMSMFLFTWSTPFQLIMALILLYQTLGVSVFAGVFLMALTVPLNYVLADKQKIFQSEILGTKDNRIRLVNEILNGMKVLKLYAWEMEFKKKVEAIRKIEIIKLFKIANIFIVLNAMAGLLPFLVGFVTFLTYVLSDPNNVLDANKAFVALALFNLLRTPMVFVTVAIVYTVQTIVSLTRVNAFLNSDDLDFSTVTHNPTNKYAIEIKSGTFSWDKDERPILEDIDIEVPEGSLVAVIGSVGSGKSSLISAILGELHKFKGQVNVKGKVGYVSQQAWIQNATVRENILFGNEYNRHKYNETLKACQLRADLEILEGGDHTEIGEKGINISGGQKQRINLARAAYSESDIFLLDDPLSAVDAYVGSAIFKELIGEEGLLAGKTRILVTHGVHWLDKVDKILVIDNGRIIEQGSYEELMEKNGYFTALLSLNAVQDSEEAPKEEEIMSGTETEREDENQRKLAVEIRNRKMSQPVKFQDSFDMSLTLNSSVKSIYPESGKLTIYETLEKGKISWDVYAIYGKAAGCIGLSVAFLGYIIFTAFLISSNFWLADWTADPIFLNKTTQTSDEAISKTHYYLAIYGIFGIGQIIAQLVYCVLFWYAMVKAGRQLHSLLLERLFHAPMSFFDQTPVGRILNRFSRDVDIVDNNLPLVIKDFTFTFFWVFSTIVVVIIQTPVFGIVLIPLVILFFLAQSFYVRTSRQLKRMESIARSPVYTHFSETVTGASVIRAYGVTKRFLAECEDRVDENQVYYFASQAAIRWLQINLDMLANFVVFFAALFQILNGGSGSDAGLSVSYALQITGSMTYMVRQVCEFETNIVCVERMKEYANIEQEADLIIKDHRPKSEWPEFGSVAFNDYTLRYRTGLQLVLKGVNCEIKSGQKVGIVGRTGAGKSSMTLGLFRIIEAAGGCITIDGINIAEIGLYDLRRRLTILPQDPVLFSGSLRMNIDPFNKYPDEDLWLALERAHLKDFVTDHPEGLLYECGEEGTNLSVGQRQLVCLARALLRKTTILVLDEATAAVDLKTDALIQTTIRTDFQECTVLAIAHRLQTIMDYDKIIVLDFGIIKEFASPQKLLKQQGIFYSMCKDAGLV